MNTQEISSMQLIDPPKFRFEDGNLIFQDADGKPVKKIFEHTKFGQPVFGHTIEGIENIFTDSGQNMLNIQYKEYQKIRQSIIFCGFGAFLVVPYLNARSSSRQRSMLSELSGNPNLEITSDLLAYVKRYLQTASLNPYIEWGGEQTVYQPKAFPKRKGVITADSLLYSWMNSESANFSPDLILPGRHVIASILHTFEKGSPYDNAWIIPNNHLVKRYQNYLLSQRRIYTNRYQI